MTDTIPTIKLNPYRLLTSLLATTFLLVVLSIWGQYLRFFQEAVDIRPWMEFWLDILNHKFYLDAETNIPTWFNSMLLLVSSGLFIVIALHKRTTRDKYRFHWFGLGFLWLIFSIDELAVLHEMLIKPMRDAVTLNNWFFFAWVIPGLVFLGVLAIAYLGFFLRLSNRFKLLFLLSMAVYFGGAVGGEMLSGHFAQTIGQKNFTYAVIASLEESIELTGASLLIFTLLKYIETYMHESHISIGKD